MATQTQFSVGDTVVATVYGVERIGEVTSVGKRLVWVLFDGSQAPQFMFPESLRTA